MVRFDQVRPWTCRRGAAGNKYCPRLGSCPALFFLLNVLLFVELEQATSSSELGPRAAPNWVGYAQYSWTQRQQTTKYRGIMSWKTLTVRFPALQCGNNNAFFTWELGILLIFLEKLAWLLAGTLIQCHHQCLVIANKLLKLYVVLKAWGVH